MPITQLPIANGFYVSDSLPISAQRAVNVFPVVEESPALVQESLRGCPGVSQVDSAGGTDGCRGSHTLDGVPYFVIGSALYRLESDETLTAISGTIAGTGSVSMAENGTQLCILVPGSTGYIYTVSGGLVTISDGDFYANGNPTAVVFLDGYFVFTTDTKKIIVSELNDGTSYIATDFGSAESSPDEVVAPIVFRNRLFVLGTETVEAFSNIGGAGFPFQRTNLFLQQGLAARFSVQLAPQTFAWIGSGRDENPAVWTIQGNATARISTRAIDRLLRELSLPELEAITSWSYGEDGHYFVGWNLPDTTIVYDFSTGRWHERTTRIETDPNVYVTQSCRMVNHITAYGSLYCGDTEDGRVGRVSLTTYDEYGADVIKQWVTQPFQNNLQPFSIPYLEMHMETGVGSVRDPIPPTIVMDRSTNGGRSFLAPRARLLGIEGQYNRRAIWRRNGRAKATDMYRFTISDPVKVAGIQLLADIRP